MDNAELKKIEEKIHESKWTGILQIFYNSGGMVGYKLFKKDKELEKKIGRNIERNKKEIDEHSKWLNQNEEMQTF